jgi:hypothetical protein
MHMMQRRAPSQQGRCKRECGVGVGVGVGVGASVSASASASVNVSGYDATAITAGQVLHLTD